MADIGSGLVESSPGPDVWVVAEEVDRDSCEALETVEKDEAGPVGNCWMSFDMCIRPVSILHSTSHVDVRSSKRGLLTPAT